MTDFPIFSCTSTREIPIFSYTRGLKTVPHSGGASLCSSSQGVYHPGVPRPFSALKAFPHDLLHFYKTIKTPALSSGCEWLSLSAMCASKAIVQATSGRKMSYLLGGCSTVSKNTTTFQFLKFSKIHGGSEPHVKFFFKLCQKLHLILLIKIL